MKRPRVLPEKREVTNSHVIYHTGIKHHCGKFRQYQLLHLKAKSSLMTIWLEKCFGQQIDFRRCSLFSQGCLGPGEGFFSLQWWGLVLVWCHLFSLSLLKNTGCRACWLNFSLLFAMNLLKTCSSRKWQTGRFHSLTTKIYPTDVLRAHKMMCVQKKCLS